MEKSTAVILTGMHRSGSSFTASLLQKAGIYMGKDLSGTAIGNSKGHFENIEFFQFHQSALNSLGLNQDGWCVSKVSHLTKQNEESANKIIKNNIRKVWGWKDPKTCLFLDVWHKKLPRAKYIFVFRAPWEVVDSLFRKGDEFILNYPEKSIELWIFYNKIILNFYRQNQSQCILVHIDKIMASSEAFLEEVNRKFSINLNKSIPSNFDKTHFIKADDKTCLMATLSPEAIHLYKTILQESWSYTSSDMEFEKDISDKILKQKMLQNWKELYSSQTSLIQTKINLEKEKESQLLLIAELDRLKKQHEHSLNDFEDRNKLIEKLKKENQHLQCMVNNYRKEARSSNLIKTSNLKKNYKD